MFLFDKDYREQRKKSRVAFQEYRRNGWQSPWVRRNSLWDILRK